MHRKGYQKWLKKSEYKPTINIENKGTWAVCTGQVQSGEWNHDTIGMVAMDCAGKSEWQLHNQWTGF